MESEDDVAGNFHRKNNKYVMSRLQGMARTLYGAARRRASRRVASRRSFKAADQLFLFDSALLQEQKDSVSYCVLRMLRILHITTYRDGRLIRDYLSSRPSRRVASRRTVF